MPAAQNVKVAYRVQDAVCLRDDLPAATLYPVLAKLMTMANLSGFLRVTTGEKERRFRVAFKTARHGLSAVLETTPDPTLVERWRAKAARLGYRFVALENLALPAGVLETVPGPVARQYGMLPLSLEGNLLTVVMAQTPSPEALERLRFLLNRPVAVALASEGLVRAAIDRCYGLSDPETLEPSLWELGETADPAFDGDPSAGFRLLELAETSPHCVAGPLVEYLRTGYRQKTFELFEEIGLHGSLCRRDAASGDLEVALPHSRLMAQMPVADAVHTVLSLVRGQFAPEAAAALRQVDLSERIPLEAPSLAMPQSAFFSKPYWGHPTRGVSLREGKAPVPIRLQTPDDTLEDKPLEDALAVGTKSTLTYLVPQGIYDRLEVWAGLHAELGVAGDVVFEVKGSDEKTLAKTQVLGSQPARRLSVPLAGQSSIQLITTAGSTDSTSNYAVWGRPRLVRSERETSVRVR